MNKKTIIICCASSMITSTLASEKVKSIASENGLPMPNKVDFIVPTGKLDKNVTENIPVIQATSFVTGVGEEKTSAEILKALKE